MKTLIKGIEHDISDIVECFMDKEFDCIITSRKSWGYTINVYAYAKEIWKNPEEVAKEIAGLLKENLVWCEEVEYIKWYVNIEFIDNFYVLLMQEMTNGNPYPERFQAYIRRQKKIQELKDTFSSVLEYIKYKFLYPRKSLRSLYWATITTLRDFYKSIRMFISSSVATIKDTKTFFIKRIRIDIFHRVFLSIMNMNRIHFNRKSRYALWYAIFSIFQWFNLL